MDRVRMFVIAVATSPRGLLFSRRTIHRRAAVAYELELNF